MTDLIYTPEFYNALEKLVDHRPHKCKSCGVTDGTRKLNKDGSKQKFERVVRLRLNGERQGASSPVSCRSYSRRKP